MNWDLLFGRLLDRWPNPRCELDFVNDYTLLVAIVLSAQTTDAGVNKATATLFKIADSPSAMLALGEGGLSHAVRSIGLWRAKSKNIIALSKQLLEEFDGVVPHRVEDLIRLPGVGTKSAHVFLNVAAGAALIGVDTHVFRVATRLGIAKAKTPQAMSVELNALVPERWRHLGNRLLVLHGRYICKAQKPQCASCPVSDQCKYCKC